MEKAYRVNIDFELQVSRKTRAVLKPAWQREWEYLFWWIAPDQDLLVSDSSSYNDKDIEYLKTKIGRKYFFSKMDKYEDWWGDPLSLDNIQKTDLPKLREKIYHDFSTSKKEPTSYPAVIKINGAFGGKGVYFLNSVDDFVKLKPRLVLNEYIVEPYRKIKLDFSYYCFDGKLIYYRSNIGPGGEYRGSLFSQNSGWIPHHDLVLDKSKQLTNGLNSIFFGVDCYFYLENNKLLLEPLCEVNSRRTIASCVYEIYQKYYSNYLFAKNLLIPMKQIRNLSDFNDKRVVRLSPRHGQYFYHVLILENSEEELLNLSNQLQKFLNRS